MALQPHLKSCLKCWDNHAKRLPCTSLEQYRITFQFCSPADWPPCPFRPSAEEVKAWLHGTPHGVEPNVSTLLKFLSKKSKEGHLMGHLDAMSSDSSGYQRHLVVYPDQSRGMRTGTFLRRTSNMAKILALLRRTFERGPMTAELRSMLESSQDPTILPPITKAARPPQVSQAFVPRPKLTVDNCGINWDALEAALQNGGTWLSVNMAAGFISRPKILDVLKGGLWRVEQAAAKGMSREYLEPELKKIVPFNLDKKGLEFALELAKGIAIVLGMAAGVAAFGTAAGAAIGTFAVPGLGTAAGAAAGASLAMALFNIVMQAYDLGTTASDIAAQEGALREACQLALDKKEEQAARKFASVFAVILAAAVVLFLAFVLKKGWNALKGKDKLGPKGKEYLQEKAAEAEARNRPDAPPAPAAFRPRIPDARKMFGKELKQLKELEAEYKQTTAGIAELAEQAFGQKWKLEDLAKLRGRWLKALRLLREYVPETAGHIQVVCAGGQVLKHRLVSLKTNPNLVKLLCDNGLSEGQAKRVAALIRKLNPGELDFGQHDLTRGGPEAAGKISPFVAARLSLDAKTLERLVEKNKKLYETYKAKFKGKQRHEIPEADKAELARRLKMSVDELEQSIEVDVGRVRHNEGFAHHQPKTLADWAEFGIDTVAAMCQQRSYKKGMKLSDLTNEEIAKVVKFMGEIEDKELADGMMKFARMILKDLDEGWLMNPQAKLGNLL